MATADNRAKIRPRGRVEVMAAVTAATAELLAERSPADVTVRAIADRAGVNHALVHRHFGSKHELLRTVIQGESARIGAVAAQLADPGTELADVIAALASHRAYWRILARSVLDAPELLGPRMPAAEAFRAVVAGRGVAGSNTAGPESTDPAAMLAGSLVLGWLIFGDHLDSAVPARDDASTYRVVADAVTAVIRAARVAPATPGGPAPSSRTARSPARSRPR